MPDIEKSALLKKNDSAGNTYVVHPYTKAENVDYDNTNSGLTSNNVKAAIDELARSKVTATGAASYQQLVTDGEGNAKWEDRLAYDTVREVKYLTNKTLTFSDTGNNLYVSTFTEMLNVSVGDTVIVAWDGVTYTCIVNDTLGMPMFGNIAITGYPEGEDTGEPFLFGYDNGNWTVGTTDSSPSHVVSVSGYGTVTKKIDAKYLDIPTPPQSDMNQVDSTKLDFIKNRTHGFISQPFTYRHFKTTTLNGWQGSYNDQNHFEFVSGASYNVSGTISITEENQASVVLDVNSTVTAYLADGNSPEITIPGTISCASNNYSKFKVRAGSFWYNISSSTGVEGTIDVDLSIGEGILLLDNKYIPRNYRVIFEETSKNVFRCNCPYSDLKAFVVAGYPVYGSLIDRIVSTETYQYNLIMVLNQDGAGRMVFVFAKGEGQEIRLYYYENGSISNKAPIG